MNSVVEKDKSFQVALKLLRYKPRTEAEMEQLLLKRSFSPVHIISTIKKLKDLRYLDDKEYTYRKCRYLAEVKLLGPIQIRIKLNAKEIKEELINKVLKDYFSQNKEVIFLQKAIAKKLRQDGKPKTLKEFKRLFDFVKRRGFNINLIWQELEKYKQNINTFR